MGGAAQTEWVGAVQTNRLDPSIFNLEKLIKAVADQVWMRHCQIIPDFQFSVSPDVKRCIVKWTDPLDPKLEPKYLRYSSGPRQGVFWDVYPNDFHSPELALVMLSQAPPPPGSRFSFLANDR